MINKLIWPSLGSMILCIGFWGALALEHTPMPQFCLEDFYQNLKPHSGVYHFDNYQLDDDLYGFFATTRVKNKKVFGFYFIDAKQIYYTSLPNKKTRKKYKAFRLDFGGRSVIAKLNYDRMRGYLWSKSTYAGHLIKYLKAKPLKLSDAVIKATLGQILGTIHSHLSLKVTDQQFPKEAIQKFTQNYKEIKEKLLRLLAKNKTALDFSKESLEKKLKTTKEAIANKSESYQKLKSHYQKYFNQNNTVEFMLFPTDQYTEDRQQLEILNHQLRNLYTVKINLEADYEIFLMNNLIYQDLYAKTLGTPEDILRVKNDKRFVDELALATEFENVAADLIRNYSTRFKQSGQLLDELYWKLALKTLAESRGRTPKYNWSLAQTFQAFLRPFDHGACYSYAKNIGALKKFRRSIASDHAAE